MKILITTDLYLPTINGVVTSVVNLKKELIKLGHDVRVLTLSNTNHSYKKDDTIYINSIGAGKIYPGARLSFTKDNFFIHELMNWHPDIIHTQSEFSTFFMARHIANRLNIPIIHTYHTVYENYTHYFSPVKSWGQAIAPKFTRRILIETDGVIAPSNKIYNLLKSYGVNQKIFVIPTGINMPPELYEDQEQKLKEIRHSLSISDDKRVIIFVGRLAKEKNLEEILEFFSKLIRTNLILLIVGDGPYRLSLESFASDLSINQDIRFTGMIPSDSVNYYYRLSDVFVSASNSETQGLTYIEALSNGIPIICKKDDCLDGVVDEGNNGWQYEDFEQFRNHLNEILAHQKSYYKLNTIDSVVRRYSSEVFAKRVETAYLETIQHYETKHNRLIEINTEITHRKSYIMTASSKYRKWRDNENSK